MKKHLILMTLLSLSACSLFEKNADESISPSISRDEIRKAIRTQLPTIKKCYEEETKINPEAEGKIVADFSIDHEGRAKSIGSRFTSFNNEESGKRVADCIQSILVETQFPTTPTGTVAEISYPFIFQKNN